MGGDNNGIVGRDPEIARLRGALDAARAGRPTVALVVGPPGIGKTALWRTVLDPQAGGGADDVVVVTATGDEAEVDLDRGVVDHLLRRAPVGGAARAALEPGPEADPVKVGAALLGLIDRVELAQALVVVVDDAQWADEASLRALTFAARRLHDDRVLLCVTCREDACDRLPGGLVRLAESAGQRIELGALDRAAVAALVERAYRRHVPAGVVARVHDHAGGNPLHTLTLLDELPFEAVAAGGPAPLPVPSSYATLVLAQVAGCRDEARAVIAALAVLGMAAPVPDVARVAGCADPRAAVDELAARGLVEVRAGTTGSVVAFPHGLVRASILADLSPSRRAALHAAAVSVTEGDEALGHRLAAAVGPDPELVAVARARAEEHIRAGSPALAARHLLAAAPLAATHAEREHLVVVAAAHLAVAGASVGPLDADVARFPDSAARSFVLGRSALNARDPAGAERLLADAWDRATSEDADADARRLAGPIADLLAILGINRRRADEIVTWARRALATGSQSGVSATLLCHGLAVDGQLAEATDEMTAILAGDPPPVLGLDARLGRGIVRVWANDLDGADQDLAAVEAGIGAVGSFLAQVDVRSYRAEVAYRAGRWPEALDLAEATASIVDDAGEPMFVALPHGVAAFVLAGMGRLAEAQRHADAAATSAEVTGLLPAQLWAAHAELRLAAARGDHAAVASVGDRLVAHGFDHFPEGIHHWRAAYVDALVALGRLADAAGISHELTGLASRHGDVSVAADAARAEGVVAAAQSRGDAARRAFEAGLALDPGTTRPFERARLELAAGAHLRRSGNRRAAAALLGQAAARFDALGAEPWASWCAQETEACGLRPRRRTAPLAGDSALTAQERLVARLAASGRTNREVAAELVISAKTVEHHLGRVYAKLGLRSRTELAARLAAGAGRQDVRSPT